MPDFLNQGGRGSDILGGGSRGGETINTPAPVTNTAGRGAEVLGGTARPGAQGNYSTPPATTSQPPAATPAAPTASPGGFGTPDWKPEYVNNSGYNPSQYANLSTTNALATGLGGNAIQTARDTGPFGVPQQNLVDFGGDTPLNAGLLAARYAKYDKATADQMTRDELAMQGPKDWSMGEQFGPGSGIAPLTGGVQALTNTGLGTAVGTAPRTVAGQMPQVPQNNYTLPYYNPQYGQNFSAAAQTPVSNPLMQLLALLQQSAPQNYNRYANSMYYPTLPRTTQTAPVAQNSGFQITPQQLLSLLLGF